jgi:hypothetical protein
MDIIYLDFAVFSRFCAVENWERKSEKEDEARVLWENGYGHSTPNVLFTYWTC